FWYARIREDLIRHRAVASNDAVGPCGQTLARDPGCTAALVTALLQQRFESLTRREQEVISMGPSLSGNGEDARAVHCRPCENGRGAQRSLTKGRVDRKHYPHSPFWDFWKYQRPIDFVSVRRIYLGWSLDLSLSSGGPPPPRSSPSTSASKV